MKPICAIISEVLLLLPLIVSADGGWQDMNGKLIPESATTKSKDGFGATLIITPDKNWKHKWNTPPETIPHFAEAKEVNAGGELFILTFLTNPLVGESDMTDVSCDFIVVRPDGTKSVNELNMPCFKVKLTTNPKQVYLSSASLKYVAEPSDPQGSWAVQIKIRDNLRKVEIPLETSFLVK